MSAERVRLTAAQRELLVLAANPAFRIQGVAIHGPQEFRVAQALDRKGVATLDVFDKLTVTDAGRAALAGDRS